MQIDVGWDVSYLASVDGYLVSKHARSWDLDWVWPVVVVEAQSVSEVKDGVLRNVRRVLRHVEMSGLHSALCHVMRHQEEIELTIDHLRLLHKSLVNVSTWWRIQDGRASFLKEPLSHSFVNDDQSNLRGLNFSVVLKSILLSHNFLKLLEFVFNNLLSHWVSNAVPVNEDVIRHFALAVLSVRLESTREVFLKDVGGNNFLTFLALRTRLSIIFAEVGVVSGYESDDALFALVTNVNTHKHSFLGYLFPKVHSPQVTA